MAIGGKRLIFGLILIFAGLWLTGRALGIIWFDFGDLFSYLIPVGLIALGIWLIVRRKRIEDRLNAEDQIHVHVHSDPPPRSDFDQQPHSQAASGTSSAAPDERFSASPEADQAGKLRYSKAIGDLFVDCEGMAIKNVEVSAGVGDVEIKLHGAKLEPGLNRLVISGFVGDVRIFIPPTISFFANASNFVGDIEMMGRTASGFGNSVDTQSLDYEQAESKLYIAVNSFIGDIKLFKL